MAPAQKDEGGLARGGNLGLNMLVRDQLAWLPIALVIAGMAAIICGAAYMVAESRLGAAQIIEEIRDGKRRLDPSG